LERQFPHLKDDPMKASAWRSPALVVAATVFLVALGAALVPVSKTARDFRKGHADDEAVMVGDEFSLLSWSALVPKDWHVADEVRQLQAQQVGVPDADPRALASLVKLREILDKAPVDPSLHGRKVRLPGYVVPLTARRGDATEFLLVPYFGACIHTPPPPANQVVHVVTERQPKPLQTMDTVWVRGTLSVATRESGEAVSGYRLSAVSVESYDLRGEQEVRQ
jgi:hypothetical protein